MAKKLTQEEKINQMYDANLASTKETLEQDYKNADAEYVRQQEQAQKTTDENLTRTAVEAQKEAVNNAEINNAAGLSSGARAQLRLSNENQMRSDMTALRVQQQETDAEIERRRALLSQEYASAIRKAQQDNDLARAEALYKEAEKQEELLRQKQEQAEAEEKANALTAAQLLAGTGNYSRLGKIYGLSDAEIAALVAADTAAKNEAKATTQAQNDLAAAKLLAEAGDYTLLGKYYGLSDEEIAKLNGINAQQPQTPSDITPSVDPVSPDPGNAADNGGLSDSQIKAMQSRLGVDVDGRWGPQSRGASQALYGTTDPVAAFQAYRKGYYNDLIETANKVKSTYSKLDYASQRANFNEAVAAFNDAYNNGIITAEQRDALIRVVTPVSR